MKTRYLFLMNGSDEICGAERLQLDYFRFINYDKYFVIFAINRDIFSCYLEKDGLPVEIVKLPSINHRDGFLSKFLKYFYFFKKIKPEVVVFHQFSLQSFSLPELFAAFIITKGNVYMILHSFPPTYSTYKSKLHFGILPGFGLYWRKERMLQSLLVYFTKYSISVSKGLRESLVKRYKYPEHKVKHLHLGVDVNKFCPSLENKIKFRKAFNISDSDVLIVSTARFYPIKKLDRLVSAFDRLAKEKENVQLIFVGTGPKYNEIISMVNSLDEDVNKRIKFLGFQEDVAYILQACDIFVLPSDLEGLSIACLETLSCGLISIVTDSVGPLDIIKDGWNGFIVKKSAEGILEGLKTAISLTENEKKIIIKNARDFIIEKFNLKNNIKSQLRLLGIDTE